MSDLDVPVKIAQEQLGQREHFDDAQHVHADDCGISPRVVGAVEGRLFSNVLECRMGSKRQRP